MAEDRLLPEDTEIKEEKDIIEEKDEQAEAAEQAADGEGAADAETETDSTGDANGADASADDGVQEKDAQDSEKGAKTEGDEKKEPEGPPPLAVKDPVTGEIIPKPYFPRRSHSSSGKPSKSDVIAGRARAMVALYSHDGEFMFKLLSSLIVAVMAALIVVLAGQSFDRMHSIVETRALVAFAVAFIAMGLFYAWLGSSGIPMYVKKHKELQSAWVSEPETAEDLLNDTAADAENQKGAGAAAYDAKGAKANQTAEAEAIDADEANEPMEQSSTPIDVPPQDEKPSDGEAQENEAADEAPPSFSPLSVTAKHIETEPEKEEQ